MTAKPLPRVLCVEDDHDSREMMTALLGSIGYEVVTASNPAEALDMVERGGFALIIIDNWYEKENGVRLCKHIRRFDTDTPIVFYSGAGRDSDVEAGLAAGAQAYVVKPDIELLLEAVARLTPNASGE